MVPIAVVTAKLSAGEAEQDSEQITEILNKMAFYKGSVGFYS